LSGAPRADVAPAKAASTKLAASDHDRTETDDLIIEK
jgi:hypothetical protein